LFSRGSRFVASLARPGGNATGFVVMEGSLGGKWLELLKEIAPRVARVAFLFNPATAPYFEYYLKPFYAAAASFGVVLTKTDKLPSGSQWLHEIKHDFFRIIARKDGEQVGSIVVRATTSPAASR
jgi:hypothetical protein